MCRTHEQAILIHPSDRQKLADRVLQQIDDPTCLSDRELKRLILLTVAKEYSGSRFSLKERQSIATRIFHAMRGLDLLQPLMEDPSITEIMVNGPSQVFYEQAGKIHPTSLAFDNVQHLNGVIANFFGRANRLIHEKQPLANMRLPDGSRVHAALPPVAPDGPVLTIRKFTGIRPDIKSIIDSQFLSREAADFLIDAVRQHKTLFICGGTGTGKTTFLNILSRFIPKQERIITIEDSAELALQDRPNWVRLETRPPDPDEHGEITLTTLIRASLRMRPDRIIVGEVRGPEAFDMLQAMNTGHPGSMCTGHANSCPDMLNRLALMVLMAIQLPWETIRSLIASALNIMIYLQRDSSGKRHVKEICMIETVKNGVIQTQPLFQRNQGGPLVPVNEP